MEKKFGATILIEIYNTEMPAKKSELYKPLCRKKDVIKGQSLAVLMNTLPQPWSAFKRNTRKRC